MLYPLIDVLRAVAALLVLVYHVTVLGEWQLFSEPLWGLPFRQGWIGVDLFLVISGFVITLSAAREREKNPDGFRWRFMQRRLKRLVPLYLLTCVVFVFLVRPEILTRPAGQLLAVVVSIGWLLKLGAWRALLLLVGLSWAWRYGTTFVLKPGEALPHLQVIYTTELPGTLDEFGIGIVLALLVHKGTGLWARRLLPGWQN